MMSDTAIWGLLLIEKTVAHVGDGLNMGYLVGVAGFEPATSWSQTMRADQLRYTPQKPYCHSIGMLA